jgi:hypothetical protein
MIYYMSLSYNFFVLELLGLELRIKMNISALKIIFFLLVYSSFIVIYNIISTYKITKMH